MGSSHGGHGSSPQAKIARAAIEAWVKEGREPSPRDAGVQEGELARRSAAFVCIKKRGRLRGCMGTLRPTLTTLAEEIAANAVSAAHRDPRFPPVTADELPQLEISVDVLSEPEAVEGASQLDPERYGVIVKLGDRVGLLLPDLEGVETAGQQLEIARRKAGIEPHEPVQLFRFTVDRFH